MANQTNLHQEPHQTRFQHKISKGSRFNQVYIPKEMESSFEVGDIVEIQLVKKKERLFASKSLQKPELGLSEFKKGVINKVFFYLENFKEIRQVFFVGSFLTEKTDYNDIDLIVITEKKGTEEKLFLFLNEKIELKFHILAVPEQKFNELAKICPLSRSMLSYFVSNKKFELPETQEINKDHINFLLMMPEDLLKLNIAEGRPYFDNLRRLLTIKLFLEKKPEDAREINQHLEAMLGEHLFNSLKKNEKQEKETISKLKKLIKKELESIKASKALK